MKTVMMRGALVAALCLATSPVFGNAFFGAASQPGSLEWDGSSNGYGSVSISTNGGATYFNVLAGQFKGLFDPASEGDGLGADDFFRFFCIDLAQFAETGPNTYTRNLGVLDGTHTATDAAELSRLFDQFYPNKSTGTYYSGGQTNFGNFPDTLSSAAFQLAIWEIWFDSDNNLNLSGGSFRADPGSPVTMQAQLYLNAIGNGSTPAAGWTLYEFNNNYKQDYLSVTYGTPLLQAPEPGTPFLLCMAILAAWGAMKFRRKTV
jgi:hypothetical protein